MSLIKSTRTKKLLTVMLFAVTIVLFMTAGALSVNAETANDAGTATAAPVGNTAPSWNWPVIITVSTIIILIIAVILAVRKADKIYGKGFDD